MKRIIENGKVVIILSIGCRSGAVYNVRAEDTPFGMYVVRQLPEGAYCCFLDEEKACYVPDKDRWLDIVPAAEQDVGGWFFPYGERIWEPRRDNQNGKETEDELTLDSSNNIGRS